MMTMRLGLIVNPIAGMGGRVGLKGTDRILKEALRRGAKPIAPARATEFLMKLQHNSIGRGIEILSCPGVMGENMAVDAGWRPQLLPMFLEKETTAEDTKKAVALLAGANADLIVFVGGDGTAKDIFDAIRTCPGMPVLGVPSGVKMYSGIFAVSPSDAVEVVLAFAEKRAQVTELEVMDADEEAARSDTFTVKLHGYLLGPFLTSHIQGSKQISPEADDEVENQKAIARFILEELPSKATLILGPGTTIRQVTDLLAVKKTILGVDIYKDGKAVLDVSEEEILREIKDWKNAWVVVSPIGRQGIVFGRGNQQISPRIIGLVGRDRIVVAATRSKLANIEGNVLRVDTGDAETDRMLRGYIRVMIDYREWKLVQVV